jgi:hypothetical protein
MSIGSTTLLYLGICFHLLGAIFPLLYRLGRRRFSLALVLRFPCKEETAERERESIRLSFQIFYTIVFVRLFNFHHHSARCGIEVTALALDASGEEINAAQIEEGRN